MCMSHITLSFLTCLIAPYSSHYLINLAIVERMFFEIKIYVSIFCTNLKHFSFQEEFRKMLPKVYIGVCVKYRLLLWGLCKVSVVVVGFV